MLDDQKLLYQLIDEEWEYRLRDDPFFATMAGDNRFNDRVPEVSVEVEARQFAFLQGLLERLEVIPREALRGKDALNYALFLRELEERIALYRHGAYLMPVARPSGPHTFLPDLVLMTPLRTEQDYAAYIRRLTGCRAYLEGHIELMRAGMRQGRVQARVALQGIEDSLRSLIVADPSKSVFFAPFLNFPAGVAEPARVELAQSGSAAVERSLTPGFQALLDFIEKEYLPAARDTIGLSALSASGDLPGGREYYNFLVRKYTTMPVTPEQVHQIGHEEVKRIRAEMGAVIAETGFTGSFHEFIAFLRSDPRFYATRPADLMKEVALLMKRMEGELPRLFQVLPRTPFGLRETPAHIAPHSTSAYYFPASGDGTTAGFYYVNTYDLPSRPLYEYEALSFHEAVPGHHLQLALQQEMQDVPNFRRYSMVDAFVEGWALYAERLGLEVGFYTDPYSNFGRLIYEMWRACRLVVDTGMHCLGWSRQQAIDFMAENTALSLLNIQNEVDRYIAWPGQALAYKMGEIKIRQLRRAAEQSLGARFDLRDFHRVLLEDGAIPLSLLEQKLQQWVAERSE